MSEQNQTNHGMRAVLAIANFRWLWIGQTISQIGDGMANLALLIVINQLTGSTAALATLMVVISVPQLIFGLVAGVFVDRWDRRRIMIISDLARGALVLGLVFVRRPEDVWVFYVLGFFQALVGVFFDPAKSAMIPTIVEREMLLSANALSQTTRVITGVVGSALAGLLVGLAGNGAPAFILDSLSFFVSAIFIYKMAVQSAPALKGGGLLQTLGQLGDGLCYLLSRRILVAIMVTFAVTMLGLGAVNVLFVPFLSNLLQVPTGFLGVIDAAQVTGMILGSGLVAVLAASLKTSQIIVFGISFLGIMVAVIGLAPSVWVVMAGLFVLGLCLTPVQAAASALMQSVVANEQRGRAGSALNTVISLASVISMGCAGLLGDAIGIRQVFYLAGATAVLAGVLAAVLLAKDKTTRVESVPA